MTVLQPQLPQNERLDALLLSEATEGLSAAEREELSGLLADELECDRRLYQRSAAQIHLSLCQRHLDSLPDHLRARLLADGHRIVSARTAAPGVIPISNLQPRRSERHEAAQPSFWTPGASGLLTAASLILAFALLMLRESPEPQDSPSLASARQSLLSVPDAIRLSWSGLEPDFEDIRGDVVWSTSQQRGYLTLQGIPVNLPRETQYQLWIVDPKRDQEPIDGGVFDYAAKGGEQIIPIDAKLEVIEPVAFALTREQPGGVVISEGPLLAVAKP